MSGLNPISKEVQPVAASKVSHILEVASGDVTEPVALTSETSFQLVAVYCTNSPRGLRPTHTLLQFVACRGWAHTCAANGCPNVSPCVLEDSVLTSAHNLKHVAESHGEAKP